MARGTSRSLRCVVITALQKSRWGKKIVIIIISSIATAQLHGTDYKTGLRLCVCVYVYPSVRTISRSHFFLSIFTEIGTDVKSKNDFVGCQHRTTHPLFCPQNPYFRPEGPENSCKYLLSYIYLKSTQIAEIFAFLGNLGDGTRW